MDEVILNIGKNGVTDAFIEEVNLHLEKKRQVKIKVLRSALGEQNTKEIAETVRKKCKCKIQGLRGHKFTLK